MCEVLLAPTSGATTGLCRSQASAICARLTPRPSATDVRGVEEVDTRFERGDVLLLMGFLWRTGPGEEGNAQAARLLDLVIDSFRGP